MMNKNLTASLLALALVLGMPSFAVLAETPANMNGWTGVSFGNPAKNIKILDSGVQVGTTFTANGAGFRILGEQVSADFSMSGASAPVHFETNVTVWPTQPITSDAMITIADNVTVRAPSLTFVRPNPANLAQNLRVTQYPTAVSVPGTQKGDPLVIKYADGTQAFRPVSADGKAYLYLSGGSYSFTAQKQNSLSPIYGYRVTVDNNNGSSTGGTAAAYSFSGGDGSAANPFEITTADQLRQLTDESLGLSGKAFVLRNDVTLSGWNKGIPNFSGTFNGGGRTVTLGGSAPLFDLIAQSGSVSDLTVNGAVSSPNSNQLGALAGQSNGSILRCASGASVSASDRNVGGLVGAQGGGTIQDSKFTGSVSVGGRESTAGGIVGYQNGGTIRSCTSSASRISGANAGGITGYSVPGTSVTQCFSTNTIDGGSGVAGGISGRSAGSISNSYSFSQVIGGDAGGIVGQLDGGEVRNSYQSNGAVSAKSAGGGIAGWQLGGNIAGNIALTPSVGGGRDKTGRVVGSSGTGSNSNNKAWDGMSVSYLSNDSGSSTKNGERLSGSDIQNANTFANMGFTAQNGWNTPANGYLPGLAGTAGAPASPTPGYTRTSSSTGGGGGGGNNEPPYSETFWENMRDRIDDADSGDKIKFSTSKLDNMPTSILRQLKGKNITLEISHGSKKIIINGKRMYDIPKNKVFYTFSDLYDLYETQPASSSKPASSSTPVQESKPLPPVTSPSTGGTTATPPPVISTPASSSSAPESSSLSAPESSSIPELPETSSREDVTADESEDKETDAQPEEKRSVVPLVIAGIVIVVALAGGGAALYYGYYKKKADEWTDDFDNSKK